MFDELIYDLNRQTKTKSYTPQLQVGDLYVFCSGRIHETFALAGKRTQITAETLLAWNDDRDAVLKYS